MDGESMSRQSRAALAGGNPTLYSIGRRSKPRVSQSMHTQHQHRKQGCSGG